MAHFAELKSKVDPTGFTTDTHQIVERVVVVGNDIATSNGPLGDNDMHVDGETWCVNFFKGGTAWKQTSYNNNFRKQYAGIGDTFDLSKDKFIKPKPYPSWSLDSNDDWQAPVTYPTVTEIDSEPVIIYWDEDNQKWLGATYTGDPIVTTNYEWDATNLQWNEV